MDMPTVDEAPQPLRSVEGALRACRDALEQDLADGPRIDAMRLPLRLLAVSAHKENVPPERVVIKLKELMHAVPEFEALPPERRDHMRDRVVHLAITSYFDWE